MFNFEIKKIDKSEKPNNGSFLQTPFWCEFKSRHGWEYRRFEIDCKLEGQDTSSACDKSENSGSGAEGVKALHKKFELAVLNRSFAKGLFSIAYIPLMPELPYECTPEEVLDQAFEDNSAGQTAVINQEIITPETQTIEFTHLMEELALALKPYLPKNTIVIRFDPDVDFSSVEDRDMFNFGVKTVAYADRLKIRKNKVDIQPPDTSLVDLTASEEEILARMHQKWRYNIRLSQKKGVIVKKYEGDSVDLSEKIDIFYKLTKETNARDGNSSHSKEYYQDLIMGSAALREKNLDVPLIRLYIAEHEEDEIASIMVLFSHDEAIYLYGASSNNKRNLMPNHLLQWTAMRDAKAYGSSYYDLYGMPPEGKDEKHPMHGLYMFKANFGGKIIHRSGSWDRPLKSIYSLYSFAEKARAFWYKKVIKKLKGR
ncbi:MAG: peptidoglycan bridge formation glycyltransferase FemA/FemB family protein [Treponema sp.]|nr:peptidoglycan bridge formation glycyltransferase FemA/FemB family protein [Treponema sp.]